MVIDSLFSALSCYRGRYNEYLHSLFNVNSIQNNLAAKEIYIAITINFQVAFKFYITYNAVLSTEGQIKTVQRKTQRKRVDRVYDVASILSP